VSLGWAHWLIALVALQRVAELLYARRNTRRLLALGAVETGAEHYPLIVILHTAWLAAMFWFTAPEPKPNWPLLVAFGVLQALRVWVIASMGPYWTTRIVVLPGSEPVESGPYRYLRHPNYLIVALEVPVLPLALGLPLIAVVFGAANAAMLAYRIRIEDLARRRVT
jgi:methyltransferase